VSLKRCSWCGAPLSVDKTRSCVRCLLLATETDADRPVELGPDDAAPCELLSVIGETARAVTFLGQQTWPLERLVAFKIFKDDAPAALAEISSEVQLHHPHINPVLERGRLGSRVYVMSPYLAGGALPTCSDRHHASAAVRVSALLAVTDALIVAHARGIGHGHLVPTNVLCEAASPGTPKIVDFLGASRGEPDATLTPALARADLDGLIGLAAVLLPGHSPQAATVIEHLRKPQAIADFARQLADLQAALARP
jgi:serine/threonine protein kinase